MGEGETELSDSLPSWATCLASLVDRKLLVLLRDGRYLVGFFRSYDQFANILLEATNERHIGQGRFADIPLGTMIVRGENVAFFGELDESSFSARITRAELRDVLQDELVQVDLRFLDEQID